MKPSPHQFQSLTKILGTTNSNGIDLQHPMTVFGNLNLAIIPFNSLSCIHQSTIMANCRSVWSTGIPSQRTRCWCTMQVTLTHAINEKQIEKGRESSCAAMYTCTWPPKTIHQVVTQARHYVPHVYGPFLARVGLIASTIIVQFSREQFGFEKHGNLKD